MASSSKRQTTMAKLAREQSVREKRVKKAQRREARIEAALHAKDEPDAIDGEFDGELAEDAGDVPLAESPTEAG